MSEESIIAITGFVITIGTTIGTAVLSHNASKELNNHTLYNKKRHEIYSEIYKLFFETINYANIKNQILINSMPAEQFSKEEIEQQIDEIKIPGKKKNELLSLYDTQKRKELDNELFDLRQQKKVVNYNNSLNEVRGYYMKNQCYMSDDITKRVDEILKILDDLYWKYDNEKFYYYHSGDPKERRESHEKITVLSKQANDKLLQFKYCIQRNLQNI